MANEAVVMEVSLCGRLQPRQGLEQMSSDESGLGTRGWEERVAGEGGLYGIQGERIGLGSWY